MIRQNIAGLPRRPLRLPARPSPPYFPSLTPVSRSANFCTDSRSTSSVACLQSSRTIRFPLTTRCQILHPTLGRQALRSYQTGSGPFQPLTPPSPSSLGAPKRAKTYPRSRKYLRRLIIATIVLGALYTLDSRIYAAGVTRSLRTFAMGLLVAADYKINFRPEPWIGASPADVHWRNAERLSELLRANGGLYLKIGQAVAMQSAVLPPEFQKMFSRMFDDAPQDDWKDVEAVVKADFGGRSVEEVFGVSFSGKDNDRGAADKGVMERKARASASVAQVHWARLPDGREVAVKVQKREIAKQISWDLWAFKTVTWIYSKWFDLPLYSLVPFITERLELETDFENEAHNSETMRKLVSNEPRLRGRVYVPVVYPELSSRRVLTTEWIEGVRLWDKQGITGTWMGGYGRGSPGVHGAQLSPPPDNTVARREYREHALDERIKPERQEWKGRRGRGGLGVSTADVMTTMVDLFSAQIFKWGVVHCDPHPGNIFIRRQPNGRAELVLIDHGLYVYMDPKFRNQYGRFWKALMTFDNDTISDVTAEWGIGAADVFASATLMRPYEGGDGRTRSGIMRGLDADMTPAERHYAMQRRMKQGIRDILGEGDKLPKELMFIGRNMRIVQANNQHLGSPVNRVKMMGEWASRSLFEDRHLPLGQRVNNAWRHALFKVVMAATDVAFYFFKLKQWLGRGGGMEEEMEKRMKEVAQEYGIELQHEVFDG